MRIAPMAAAGLLLASPAAAQDSHCASLPTGARVAPRGPDTLVAAQLTPQGLSCPRGFETERMGGVTRCRRAGVAQAETRDPRAACYRDLPLGPVQALGGLRRPTFSCPQRPTIDNIVAVRGRNVGWADVTLTAPPASSVTITHLRGTGGQTPAAEDPTLNDCFPHDCRLIRLTTRAGTPARIELTLATPGNETATTFTISTEATCPAR